LTEVLQRLLGIELPIIQAPMAGAQVGALSLLASDGTSSAGLLSRNSNRQRR
jgi:hypothetical protein